MQKISGFRSEMFSGGAERVPDGRRTFKLAEGEPLQTSYGQDLYNEAFGVEDQTVVAGQTMSS